MSAAQKYHTETLTIDLVQATKCIVLPVNCVWGLTSIVNNELYCHGEKKHPKFGENQCKPNGNDGLQGRLSGSPQPSPAASSRCPGRRRGWPPWEAWSGPWYWIRWYNKTTLGHVVIWFGGRVHFDLDGTDGRQSYTKQPETGRWQFPAKPFENLVIISETSVDGLEMKSRKIRAVNGKLFWISQNFCVFWLRRALREKRKPWYVGKHGHLVEMKIYTDTSRLHA